MSKINIERIGEIFFAVCASIFLLFLLVGSVLYFGNEIQDASWDKIVFYSCLILILTSNIQNFLVYPLNIIFKNKVKKK